MMLNALTGAAAKVWRPAFVLIVAGAVVVMAAAGSLQLYEIIGWLGGQRLVARQPYFRLNDPEPQTDALASKILATARKEHELPVATIRDDTRYVLDPIPRATLVYDPHATVSPDGTLSYTPDLPVPFRDAQRLVVVWQVEQKLERKTVVQLETLTPGASNVGISLALPQTIPGTEVEVFVEGMIPAGLVTSHNTAAVRIPKGASLEFAIGIAEPAWEQGQVIFSIEACERGRCKSVFAEVLDPAVEAGRAWQDRRVSLESLAGTKPTFQLTTRLINPAPDAYSFPLWANPTIYAPVADGRDKLNVILLSIDTLSAKHLATYGYRFDTAPFIKETFGRGGTVFDRCVGAATTTGPSTMTMLTSLQPSVHGVGIHTGLEVLQPWLLTLAEILRAAGFETAGITEDGWVALDNGFGRGFNMYAENKSVDVWVPTGQVDKTFAKAKQWLSQNRDKRFFLFLHTYQVHSPYTPPAQYNGLFAEDGGQPVTDQSPLHVRNRAAYDQEIRYCDDELRSLFQTIKELGLDRNTIFILTSDHGEEFLEHGRLEHGAQLYDEVTRVPLMFWGPGRVPRARRIAELVGLIDLMPTILELAGVPAPPQVGGASLAAALLGRSAAPQRPSFDEAWAPSAELEDASLQEVLPPAYMIQLGMRKLSRYRDANGFRYEYYDLTTDPDERRNVFVDGDPEVANLRAALDGYEQAAQGQAMGLEIADKLRDRATAPVKLDAAQEEKLRALGYLK